MRKILIFISVILIIMYSFVAGGYCVQGNYLKVGIYIFCAICWSVVFYLQTIMDTEEGRH